MKKLIFIFLVFVSCDVRADDKPKTNMNFSILDSVGIDGGNFTMQVIRDEPRKVTCWLVVSERRLDVPVSISCLPTQ